MLGDLHNAMPGGTKGVYGDPMRLWAHSFSSRNLKQLFRWTEYLYYNSAQIYAGTRKFAEYPITELEYLSDSDKLTSLYRRLLEDIVGVKRCLIKASIDLQVYGNSFTSLHLKQSHSLLQDLAILQTAFFDSTWTQLGNTLILGEKMRCSSAALRSLSWR